MGASPFSIWNNKSATAQNLRLLLIYPINRGHRSLCLRFCFTNGSNTTASTVWKPIASIPHPLHGRSIYNKMLALEAVTISAQRFENNRLSLQRLCKRLFTISIIQLSLSSKTYSKTPARASSTWSETQFICKTLSICIIGIVYHEGAVRISPCPTKSSCLRTLSVKSMSLKWKSYSCMYLCDRPSEAVQFSTRPHSTLVSPWNWLQLDQSHTTRGIAWIRSSPKSSKCWNCSIFSSSDLESSLYCRVLHIMCPW